MPFGKAVSVDKKSGRDGTGAGARKPESVAEALATVTFLPGPLGFNVGGKEQCVIENVHPGGQAAREGVKKGWRIRAVGGDPCGSFREKIFLDAKNGSVPYQVTFMKVIPKIGGVAKIIGLSSSAGMILNGKYCKLLERSDETSRWTVELMDGSKEEKALKEENLDCLEEESGRRLEEGLERERLTQAEEEKIKKDEELETQRRAEEKRMHVEEEIAKERLRQAEEEQRRLDAELETRRRAEEEEQRRLENERLLQFEEEKRRVDEERNTSLKEDIEKERLRQNEEETERLHLKAEQHALDTQRSLEEQTNYHEEEQGQECLRHAKDQQIMEETRQATDTEEQVLAKEQEEAKPAAEKKPVEDNTAEEQRVAEEHPNGVAELNVVEERSAVEDQLGASNAAAELETIRQEQAAEDRGAKLEVPAGNDEQLNSSIQSGAQFEIWDADCATEMLGVVTVSRRNSEEEVLLNAPLKHAISEIRAEQDTIEMQTVACKTAEHTTEELDEEADQNDMIDEAATRATEEAQQVAEDTKLQTPEKSRQEIGAIAKEVAKLHAEKRARVRADKEAKRKANDEAKQKIEEAAIQRALEEAMLEAEEEAKQRAEEKHKVETDAEEVSKQVDEEAVRVQVEKESMQRVDEETRAIAEEDEQSRKHCQFEATCQAEEKKENAKRQIKEMPRVRFEEEGDEETSEVAKAPEKAMMKIEEDCVEKASVDVKEETQQQLVTRTEEKHPQVEVEATAQIQFDVASQVEGQTEAKQNIDDKVRMQEGESSILSSPRLVAIADPAMSDLAKQIGIRDDEIDAFGWIAERGLESDLLPSRWSIRRDASNGAAYYVTKDDNSLSWENPNLKALQSVLTFARRFMERPIKDNLDAIKESLWHDHKTSLQSWFGPVHDVNGFPYYFNISGESSWQDPRKEAQFAFDVECILLDSLGEMIAAKFEEEKRGKLDAKVDETEATRCESAALQENDKQTSSRFREVLRRRSMQSGSSLAIGDGMSLMSQPLPANEARISNDGIVVGPPGKELELTRSTSRLSCALSKIQEVTDRGIQDTESWDDMASAKAEGLEAALQDSAIREKPWEESNNKSQGPLQEGCPALDGNLKALKSEAMENARAQVKDSETFLAKGPDRGKIMQKPTENAEGTECADAATRERILQELNQTLQGGQQSQSNSQAITPEVAQANAANAKETPVLSKLESAATRIQAIQRGRAARQNLKVVYAVGSQVEYYSDSYERWLPAVVEEYKDGFYKLNIKPRAESSRLRKAQVLATSAMTTDEMQQPSWMNDARVKAQRRSLGYDADAGQDTSLLDVMQQTLKPELDGEDGDEVYPVGTHVEYQSFSFGKWVPGVVQDYKHGCYRLSCKPRAERSRVRKLQEPAASRASAVGESTIAVSTLQRKTIDPSKAEHEDLRWSQKDANQERCTVAGSGSAACLALRKSSSQTQLDKKKDKTSRKMLTVMELEQKIRKRNQQCKEENDSLRQQIAHLRQQLLSDTNPL